MVVQFFASMCRACHYNWKSNEGDRFFCRSYDFLNLPCAAWRSLSGERKNEVAIYMKRQYSRYPWDFRYTQQHAWLSHTQCLEWLRSALVALLEGDTPMQMKSSSYMSAEDWVCVVLEIDIRAGNSLTWTEWQAFSNFRQFCMLPRTEFKVNLDFAFLRFAIIIDNAAGLAFQLTRYQASLTCHPRRNQRWHKSTSATLWRPWKTRLRKCWAGPERWAGR